MQVASLIATPMQIDIERQWIHLVADLNGIGDWNWQVGHIIVINDG